MASLLAIILWAKFVLARKTLGVIFLRRGH